LEEFCSTRWKKRKICETFVKGQIGDQLFFKLRPIASRNHGHLNCTEEIMQQGRHFGIKRRFTFGKCTVQIKYN